MPETAKFTYRAFLSYSHRDHEWGDWVHRRLESWPVPKDLVGQVKAAGPVPPKLRPIFRDRFDLEAGHSLREQVAAALGASEALIVVCSPHSAKSTYVNEEIRQFKALGRADRRGCTGRRRWQGARDPQTDRRPGRHRSRRDSQA